MFTNEMKIKMIVFNQTHEDACFSVYVDNDFDSAFYNLEYLMKFVLTEGFLITDVEESTFGHDMAIDVSKPRTTSELLDFGLSFKEVNKYLKEQEEALQRQFEFLDDLQDDFEAYNEKTPETSKMMSAIMEGMAKTAWEKTPACRGGLVFVKKPVIKARVVEPVSKDFVIINGAGIKLKDPLTDSAFDKLKENFEKNGGIMP